MRRRAERPTLSEMHEVILLGCFRRDECPNPRRFAELNAKIAAWEREQERMKDPIGSLVKRMNDGETLVSYSDSSLLPTEPRVRVTFFREASQSYEMDPLPESIDDIRASEMVARIVTVPRAHLAENVELSLRMLTDDEWDYEDEICDELRECAAQLTEAAQMKKAPSGVNRTGRTVPL